MRKRRAADPAARNLHPTTAYAEEAVLLSSQEVQLLGNQGPTPRPKMV